MTNDCWNEIEIAAEEDIIKQIYFNELKPIIQQFQRMAYAPNHRLTRLCKKGIIIKMWSPNEPDYKFLEKLLEKYQKVHIKNLWTEEGGYGGAWVGSYDHKKQETKIENFRWDELCIEGYNYHFSEEVKEKQLV